MPPVPEKQTIDIDMGTVKIAFMLFCEKGQGVDPTRATSLDSGGHKEITSRTVPNNRGDFDVLRFSVESPAIGSACLVWYALSGKISKS